MADLTAVQRSRPAEETEGRSLVQSAARGTPESPAAQISSSAEEVMESMGGVGRWRRRP